MTPAALVSIAVTPASPSIAKGLTEQFTATGTYTDNSTQNLTSQVDLGVGHHVGRHHQRAVVWPNRVATGTTNITATMDGSSPARPNADGDCRDAGLDRRDPDRARASPRG